VKIAALLLSLAAGIAGCTLVALGTLDAAILALTGLGVHPAGFVRALLLVLPELALLSTGLVLSRPIAGGIAQLVAAAAWLPIVILWTPESILLNLVPAAFMVLAAILAFGIAVERAHLRQPDRPARVRLGDGPGRWEEPPLVRAAPLPSRPAVVPRDDQRAEPSFDFGPRNEPEEEVEEEDYQTTVEPPPSPPYYRPSLDQGPYVPSQHDSEPLEVRYSQAFDDDETTHRGPSAFRRAVAVINFMAFVTLALGAGGVVFLDYNRGPRSVFFHDGRVPATAPVAMPQPSAAAPLQAAIAPAAPAPQTIPTPAPVSEPVAEISTPDTYADPVSYCAAVDTIDAPDASYVGARVPPAVVSAIGASAKKYPNQVHWRCAHRIPMACLAHDGPLCDRLPTLDQMFEHCKSKPGPAPIRVPNGAWHCEGTKPVIPQNDEWPTDSFGYYPPAWTPVAVTASAAPAKQ
jgi:hypothetical protein